MKVVGYGICGPGEAGRYMKETLEEYKRLCDVAVILLNGTQDSVQPEIDLITQYGFKWTLDGREWGKMQWKIKQDFLQREVARYADQGDMVVCLDMDETFDRRLTKQWLLEAELDAYHVFVVDLWNDPKHFKLESCFWNVRIFRWNGDVAFKQKALHCGLAPAWAYFYNRFAPFLLLHKGLMDPKDRARKIARYDKYDPNAQYLAKSYYAMLHSDTAEPFDEAELGAKISAEVATYKQSRPRGPNLYMNKQAERYAYFRNAAGMTLDVPEKHVELTKKQPGMTFVGWADDAAKEIEELFDEDEVMLDDVQQADTVLNSPEPAPVIATGAGVPAPQHNRVGVERAPRPVKRQIKK